MGEKVSNWRNFLLKGMYSKDTGKNEKRLSSFRVKVFKAAFWFFLIFFVCGLISRGMYGALLPRVSVDYPSNMYLNHSVEAEGEIVENKRTAVTAEPGIRIESILVKEGESVEQGAPLVQLDLADLEDLIEDKEIEIEKYRIQIQAMEKNEALQAEEKAVNLKRANEDYKNANEKGSSNVEKATSQVNDAKAERDQFLSKKEYVEAGKEQDQEYCSLYASLAEKKNQLDTLKTQTEEEKNEEEIEKIKKEQKELLEEIEEVKANLSAYEESLTTTLEQEWETKRAQLEQAVADSEESAKQTISQKDEDMLLAARAVEDANKEASADSALEIAKLEKRELEKQLAVYRQIKEKEGKILAPVEGDIVQIHGVEGDRTGDGAILHMTDRKQGYYFTAEISKENKKYISLGDLVDVTIGSDKESFKDMKVEAIVESEDKEDTYQVSFPVTEEMGNLGDRGTMKATAKGENKTFCVPLAAIHSDGNQNYVLIMSTVETILGDELKTVRKNITILDKNESYASINTESITENDRIIISSTKQIKEGDTVRLLEN